MPAITDLSAFFLSSLLLLLTPGPAVLYIISRSLEQGRKAGLISVLGIETGNFCHVLAVTFGLAVILQTSVVAYLILKYLGAIYLIFLGIQHLLTVAHPITTASETFHKLSQVYFNGVLVAVLNPKTALFFLAFLPQFINPGEYSSTSQFFFLGSLFVIMALVTDGLYSLLAVTLRARIINNPIFPIIERYIVGFIYIGIGIAAVCTIKGVTY